MPYLFVHFREKTTPDGEQVYFGISRDGFHWEPVNGGAPVLWSYLGERGVRDCAIARCRDGKFRILATDLSLSYRYHREGRLDWPKIGRTGSKSLVCWESEDLVEWSAQRLLPLGGPDFGCLWAPDLLYDPQQGDYLIHWSSTHRDTPYMGIWCCRTKDFETFTEPVPLYHAPNCDVIDSAIYEEDGVYHLFLKNGADPEKTVLLKAHRAQGPYARVAAFDESMAAVEAGLYEGPTAARLPDGRWCLMLDFYGARGSGQGYVPFLGSLSLGRFSRADRDFSFPYGYKHGSILDIGEDEYLRVKAHDFSDKGYP